MPGVARMFSMSARKGESFRLSPESAPTVIWKSVRSTDTIIGGKLPIHQASPSSRASEDLIGPATSSLIRIIHRHGPPVAANGAGCSASDQLMHGRSRGHVHHRVVPSRPQTDRHGRHPRQDVTPPCRRTCFLHTAYRSRSGRDSRLPVKRWTPQNRANRNTSNHPGCEPAISPSCFLTVGLYDL